MEVDTERALGNPKHSLADARSAVIEAKGLVAPAGVAVERNRHRREPGKEKSDNYIAFNHRHVRLPSFKGAHTVEVNTNRSRAETVQDLRSIVWQLL